MTTYMRLGQKCDSGCVKVRGPTLYRLRELEYCRKNTVPCFRVLRKKKPPTQIALSGWRNDRSWLRTQSRDQQGKTEFSRRE